MLMELHGMITLINNNIREINLNYNEEKKNRMVHLAGHIFLEPSLMIFFSIVWILLQDYKPF